MQLRAPWSDTGYNTNAKCNTTIIIPCEFGDFSGSELPLLHYSASVSHTRENGIKVNFSMAPAGAVASTKKPHCYVSLLQEAKAAKGVLLENLQITVVKRLFSLDGV